MRPTDPDPWAATLRLLVALPPPVPTCSALPARCHLISDRVPDEWKEIDAPKFRRMAMLPGWLQGDLDEQ